MMDESGNSTGIRTIKRSELFDLVWNEPMRTLAPKFGLSDVGLAKLCRRNSVPLPPMGYWARGTKKRRRPNLPPAPKGGSEVLRIIPSQIRKHDVTSDLAPEFVGLIASVTRASEIDVPASCPRTYKMFEKWDATVRRDPWLTDRRPSLTQIEKRRRRILYALIREIEKWEGRVVPIDQRRFKVIFEGDDAEFTFREPSNKILRPLTGARKTLVA